MNLPPIQGRGAADTPKNRFEAKHQFKDEEAWIRVYETPSFTNPRPRCMMMAQFTEGSMKKVLFSFIIMTSFFIPRSSFAATDEQNKQILKDAIVGAVTGVVSTEGSKDKAVPATAPETGKGPHKNFTKKHHHHRHEDDDDDDDDDHDGHHDKDKHRPHGWDMGKKKGWGGKDVPPGLARKNS